MKRKRVAPVTGAPLVNTDLLPKKRRVKKKSAPTPSVKKPAALPRREKPESATSFVAQDRNNEAFYYRAGNALDAVLRYKCSIKTAALSSRQQIPAKDKKGTYALLCEVIKHFPVLEALLPHVEHDGIEGGKALLLCLLHDTLLRKQGLQCGGQLKQMMRGQKDALQQHLQAHLASLGKKTVKEAVADRLATLKAMPKYIRVNTHKATLVSVIEHLTKKGFTSTTRLVPEAQTYRVDKDVPNLIALPPAINLIEDPFYLSQKFVIQDKSSCFPAMILDPPPNAVCIDACAAPGNKTQHLSCLLGEKGKIHAFDMDARRLETLIEQMDLTGAKNVTATNQSFLEVDPKDYQEVTHLLLDPSCSGSGMLLGKIDALIPQNTNIEARHAELASFQLKCIEHAFTFTNAQRVVYSTCSIDALENEEVVLRALKANPAWEIVPIMPQWKRRGTGDNAKKEVAKCVRVLPEDGASGFFVALFQRKSIKKKSK